jgi:4-amino-4-deoxy-L-arabinose transferase-like glycosyltransferase
MVSAAVTIYYGYRLLRLFRCRGASLVVGVALLTSLPVLFISSYGAEADVVLTAILSAFIYYFARDFAGSGSVPAAVRLGVLAGLAAATKYSGLVAIVSASILFTIRIASGPHRVLAVRNAVIVAALCAAVGGWKYVDNYRRYETPFHANGSAQEGFSFAGRRVIGGHYEFHTLRLSELMRVFGPQAGRGALTDLPVYHSVFTTLHALTWTDMSFFSEPDRHGDPTHPYPRKRIPPGLIGAVLVLGFVPELLAAVGFIVTIRRPRFLPLTIVCVVGISAYVWWFVSQESWALKAKYLLFLVSPSVIYTVIGLTFLWNRAPRAGVAAAVLVAALIVAANVYLVVFAVA